MIHTMATILCYLFMCSPLLCISGIYCYNVDTSNAMVINGPEESYFGYSVALLNNSQGSWILVGAPKADSIKRVNSSGALYKCPIHTPGPCVQVKLDTRGNGWEMFNRTRFRSRKDYQWLGSSVDIKPSFNSKVAVCAHRWSDSQFRNYHYLVNGMCFEIGEELEFKTVRRLYPLSDIRRIASTSGKFIFGTGMAGFSVHYAQDSSLLLGAPGIHDWQGGVIRYNGRTKTIGEKYLESDGYVGYSLSSGKMYGGKRTYYITGAPKAGQTGEVYVLNDAMQITTTVSGKQIGENFGSSVLAMDVNGDGLDDLIVGAPLHSVTVEEGRVYVFINKDLGVFSELSVLFGLGKPWSQFGAALCNVRDINLDGYPDIIIGAPFEDGTGAIYIYNGDKGRLREEFSQRIPSNLINKGLSGFGAAFSRVHDIDGNSYGDFAVGSFLSNQVVLLRGRPVINLKVQIKFSVRRIDLEERKCEVLGVPVTCFTVTVCFQLEGTSVRNNAEVLYNLTADTMLYQNEESPRISIRDNGLRQSVLRETLVTRDSYTCNQHQAMAFESADIITPVRFGVSFELSPNQSKASNSSSEPVLNIYRTKKVSKEILYLKDCGNDNICSTDLELETKLIIPGKRDYLISGEDSYISHEIRVTNRREPAYLTNVYITYPPNLQYVRVNTARGPRSVVCTPFVPDDTYLQRENVTESESPTIVCDIGNPVRTFESVLLQVKIFVDSRDPQRDPLQIRTEARTGSAEGNDSLSDNLSLDYLLIRLKSALILTGVSSPEQMRMLRVNFESQSRDILNEILKHVYEIGNLGPSMLPMGTMYLTVMLDRRLQNMVSLANVQLIDPSTGLVIEDGCSVQKPLNIEMKTSEDKGQNAYSEIRDRRSYSLTSRRVKHLCEGLHCIRSHCTVRNLQPETSVHVRLNIIVHSNVFVEIQETNLLQINSSARFVEELDPMYIAAISPDRYNKTIVTNLFTDDRRSRVSLWALVASCGAGLLAVLAMTILLWRIGFFRRKKREDLIRLTHAIDEREGRTNTVEQDDVQIRLRPMCSPQDRGCTDSIDYEEPIRNNGNVSHGHRSRLLQR